MTNELAVQQYGSAVALPPQVQDMSGLSDVAKLKPTNLTLIQPMTFDAQGGRPGQILDELTGRVYDTVTVVPLKVAKQRVLFPPGDYVAGVKPLCRSNDSILPSTFIEFPQHKTCKGCPMSVWAGGKPSPCKQKLKLLVVMKDNGLPRWLQFGGKSYSPAQSLMDNIAQDIHIKSKLTPPMYLKLHDYCFDLSLEKSGTNYVARFKKIQQIANPGEFGPLFQQFVIDAYNTGEDDEQVAATAVTEQAVADVVTAEFVNV